MSWPHAPKHGLFTPGIYFVTASTYKKYPHLKTAARKDFFQHLLFQIAADFGWQLQAWAILQNHYHFIAVSPDNPRTLSRFIGKLHMLSAKNFNLQDQTPGRKVWFQFWDTHLTYQKSYLARLNYVNHNPVKHGLVHNAENYPWCSASWFVQNAPPAFVETVQRFKTDRIKVYDDF